MTWWSPAFCRALADRGFFVIRYDNRDTGRSSRAPGRVTRADAGADLRRPARRAAAAVHAGDLADDGFGLLDHLGLESAHVVGISMGGMIVQTMALLRPDRVRSLTSIMSTTGRRTVGWQDPRLLPRLLERRATTREAYVDGSARFWAVIGSLVYPDTERGRPGPRRRDLGPRDQRRRRRPADGRDRVPARPDRAAAGGHRAHAGDPRHRGQDGARLRRPGHLARDPRLGAAAGARAWATTSPSSCTTRSRTRSGGSPTALSR